MKRALAAISLMTLASCALLAGAFKPPEVSFDLARFRAADFSKLGVDLIFDITNPNALGAAVDSYDLKFVVDGLTLLDGTVQEGLDLSGNTTSKMVLPATVKWAELASRITKGGVPDDLPWSASGELRFDTPIGPLGIPFGVSGKLPVVKPPAIKPLALRVTRASLTQVSLAFDFEVENKTGHRVSLSSLSHRLRLQGREVAKGTLSKAVKVGARGTAKQTLGVDLSLASVGSAIASALVGGGSLDVRLSGKTSVDTGYGKVPWNFDARKSLGVRR
jgi:LEA14-like dessication related protein